MWIKAESRWRIRKRNFSRGWERVRTDRRSKLEYGNKVVETSAPLMPVLLMEGFVIFSYLYEIREWRQGKAGPVKYNRQPELQSLMPKTKRVDIVKDLEMHALSHTDIHRKIYKHTDTDGKDVFTSTTTGPHPSTGRADRIYRPRGEIDFRTRTPHLGPRSLCRHWHPSHK